MKGQAGKRKKVDVQTNKEQEKDESKGLCCQSVALSAMREPSKCRGWTEHTEERSGGRAEQQEDRQGEKCRTGSQGEEETWKHRKEGAKARAKRESG